MAKKKQTKTRSRPMKPTEKTTADKQAADREADREAEHDRSARLKTEPAGPPAPDPGATRRVGERLPPENSAEEIRQKSEASGPIPPPPKDTDVENREKLAKSKRHDVEGQVALDSSGAGDYIVVDVPGDSPTRAREHRISIDGKLYEHVGFHEGLWAYR